MSYNNIKSNIELLKTKILSIMSLKLKKFQIIVGLFILFIAL